MKKILFMILVIMMFAGSAWAGEVTLAWDAPTIDADHGAPLGYIVYFGQETDKAAYNVRVDASFTQVTITNLAAGLTFYFVVTAYNDDGESGPSNEVSKTIPAFDPPDDVLPTGVNVIPGSPSIP